MLSRVVKVLTFLSENIDLVEFEGRSSDAKRKMFEEEELGSRVSDELKLVADTELSAVVTGVAPVVKNVGLLSEKSWNT